MNLVDWFKGMVASRRSEEVVDPLIDVPPPPRALKRILLLCLRCIDLDANKRPKMGQIVHMLEADEFPFRVVINQSSLSALEFKRTSTHALLICRSTTYILLINGSFFVSMQEHRTVRDSVPEASGSNKAQLTKKEEGNEEEGRIRRR